MDNANPLSSVNGPNGNHATHMRDTPDATARAEVQPCEPANLIIAKRETARMTVPRSPNFAR